MEFLTMGLSRRADPLRVIAARLGITEFRLMTQQPTVNEALRITIHYDDVRKADSVATLVRGHHRVDCSLTVIYDRPQKPATLSFTIPQARYQSLLGALRRARFDHLDDQPELAFIGIDLWLIERAAGSFHHDVVLAPTSATGNYREFVRAFEEYLPESVRSST